MRLRTKTGAIRLMVEFQLKLWSKSKSGITMAKNRRKIRYMNWRC